MNVSIRRRLVRRYVAALLALAAGAVLAPTVSSAGCVNHVVSGSDPLDVVSLSSLGIFDLAATTPGDRPDAPPQRRSPCSGMSCSQAPSLPLVPASNGSERIDQWGCLTAPRPADPEPVDTLLDEIRVRPVHTGSSLDRPPRHVSLLD